MRNVQGSHESVPQPTCCDDGATIAWKRSGKVLMASAADVASDDDAGGASAAAGGVLVYL